MNILFIAHEREVNGASKSMLELIECMKNRHHIYVLTSYFDGPLVNCLKEKNIEYITLPFYRWSDRKNIYFRWLGYKIRWALWGNKKNQCTAEKVLKFVEGKKIDIIHTNSSVIDIGIRVRKMTNVKHIMHIREFGDLDFNMVPFIPYDKYYAQMNHGVDNFICISKAIFNYYEQLDKEKKIIIYNGISKNNICTERMAHTTFNIIISGRVSKEKGQNVAIKAIGILVKNGYTNIKLYIVGSGRIIIPVKYSTYIEKIGYVKDMSSIRKKMDVEVVCSKAEAFGRVTIEAMINGIPVIGSNTGGTPELISDGVDGFLFEAGNAEMLAEKIKYFIDNRQEVKKFGEKARIHASKYYSIERCYSDIEAVYVK